MQVMYDAAFGSGCSGTLVGDLLLELLPATLFAQVVQTSSGNTSASPETCSGRIYFTMSYAKAQKGEDAGTRVA